MQIEGRFYERGFFHGIKELGSPYVDRWRPGAFYTQHRAELHAHASRVLKDQVKAKEITHDALIKFMLAAPELDSEEHTLFI